MRGLPQTWVIKPTALRNQLSSIFAASYICRLGINSRGRNFEKDKRIRFRSDVWGTSRVPTDKINIYSESSKNFAHFLSLCHFDRKPLELCWTRKIDFSILITYQSALKLNLPYTPDNLQHFTFWELVKIPSASKRTVSYMEETEDRTTTEKTFAPPLRRLLLAITRLPVDRFG